MKSHQYLVPLLLASGASAFSVTTTNQRSTTSLEASRRSFFTAVATSAAVLAPIPAFAEFDDLSMPSPDEDKAAQVCGCVYCSDMKNFPSGLDSFAVFGILASMNPVTAPTTI